MTEELEKVTSLLEDAGEEEIDDGLEEGVGPAEDVVKEASEDAEETLPPQERSRGVSISNAKRFRFISWLFYPMKMRADISMHPKSGEIRSGWRKKINYRANAFRSSGAPHPCINGF